MGQGANTFGNLFKWTTFGESHGPAMGVVIDGCPAGVSLDEGLLQKNLQKRRPGDKGASGRAEMDIPEILSGVFENKTLGTPIAVVVRNHSQRSQDYSSIQQSPRIGHADDLWQKKFSHWDYRGGGRASARETLNWVIAGSFAEMYLRSQKSKMQVEAHILEIGGHSTTGKSQHELEEFLEDAKNSFESYGALVQLKVFNPPPLLGEPIFFKLKSELARAFMMINACCGVEFGQGFELAKLKGSEAHVDEKSAIYGGIRGGISTGEPIIMRLAFKPISSILDVAKKGRHDPCVAIRALPIVEAMAWNVLADLHLWRKLNKAE